jgi:hypothetical protein
MSWTVDEWIRVRYGFRWTRIAQVHV